MSNPVSLMYWNDSVQRGDVYCLTLLYKITAAKTVTQVNGSASLSTFDAYASQAVMDAYLGTSSEFLLAAFDAVAMGVDAFGGLVNLGGQAKELCGMNITLGSGANGGTIVEQQVVNSASMTASSLTTQAALGSSGNLAFRAVLAGLDILTGGLIKVELYWRSK